jgi:hypothetical protein
MQGDFRRAISDYNAYTKQGNLNAADADCATAKRIKAAQ